MGVFGGGPKPSVPDIPAAPPAAAPATLADPSIAANAAAQRNKNLSAAAAVGTLGPMSAQGISVAPPTAKASLLGEGGGR